MLKNFLCSYNLLAHYDPSFELGISCNPSEVGIGVVRFYRYSYGSEKTIVNLSRTLTDMKI